MQSILIKNITTKLWQCLKKIVMSNQHIYGQQIGFITDGIKNIKIFHQLINTQSLWIKGITTNCSNT